MTHDFKTEYQDNIKNIHSMFIIVNNVQQTFYLKQITIITKKIWTFSEILF